MLIIALLISLSFIVMEKNAYAETWRNSIGTTGFQRQENTLWCWVASARNMDVSKVTHVNVKKNQRTVVKQIKGDIKNYGALLMTSKKQPKFSTQAVFLPTENQSYL